MKTGLALGNTGLISKEKGEDVIQLQGNHSTEETNCDSEHELTTQFRSTFMQMWIHCNIQRLTELKLKGKLLFKLDDVGVV